MPVDVVRFRRATVIGGGPAGLMAAEVLATAGLEVTVYDHMPSVGRKFLLAGRGGLNLTHSEPTEELLARYGARRKPLRRAIQAFDSDALRAWSEGLGEPTFIGSSGRVFPESFRATPLLRAWLGRLGELGVTIKVRHRWTGWGATSGGTLDGRCLSFVDSDGANVEVASDLTVIALGGASWPRVGSDGSWVSVFRSAGVEVKELQPANCGFQIGWTSDFAERFGGVPLKNVSIGVAGNFVRGDAMITSYGIEGGPIYAHSSSIREAIDREGSCKITIDLQPDLTVETLAHRLDRRRPKDSFTTSMKRIVGLAPASVGLLREATENRLPTESAPLARLIKTARLTTTAPQPIARAISSAGGVSMSEIDDSYMLHKLPGVFVAGEMLDWEAPTGGYLLQASFSTAVAAARGAVAWLDAEEAQRTRR
jgi:uncharacterized flavoprotein (TIGR03862 family)